MLVEYPWPNAGHADTTRIPSANESRLDDCLMVTSKPWPDVRVF